MLTAVHRSGIVRVFMSTKNKPGTPKRYHVPGLERGLDLLELLSADRQPATVADLTRRLNLPRSSVFRLLHTLEDKGYLQVDPTGKTFVLGARVLQLGYQFLASRDVVQLARGDIEALARATGISAHLVVRDGRDIVYVLHALGSSTFVSNLGIGDRLPAHATPTGQFLLSNLSSEELAKLYRGVKLEPTSPQSPKSIVALAKVIATAAAAGYLVSLGAVHRGGMTIAAPVRDAGGHVVAGVDISGPDDAFDRREIHGQYKKAVLAAAATISARLGYVA